MATVSSSPRPTTRVEVASSCAEGAVGDVFIGWELFVELPAAGFAVEFVDGRRSLGDGRPVPTCVEVPDHANHCHTTVGKTRGRVPSTHVVFSTSRRVDPKAEINRVLNTEGEFSPAPNAYSPVAARTSATVASVLNAVPP